MCLFTFFHTGFWVVLKVFLLWTCLLFLFGLMFELQACILPQSYKPPPAISISPYPCCTYVQIYMFAEITRWCGIEIQVHICFKIWCCKKNFWQWEIHKIVLNCGIDLHFPYHWLLLALCFPSWKCTFLLVCIFLNYLWVSLYVIYINPFPFYF